MPCAVDCKGRKAGCAIDCEAWKQYVLWRDEQYQKRKLERDVLGVVAEGCRRVKYDIKK